MEEQITIKIPNVSFSSVVEARTNKFIKSFFGTTDLINEARDSTSYWSISARIQKGLDDNQTDTNKTIFLTHLLNHFLSLLPKVDDGTLGEGTINNLDLIYNTRSLIEEIIFEISQHLESLGLSINSDIFTPNEYAEVNCLLEQILRELEIVKGGNAILGDQIEELQNDLQDIKSSMVLGKKPLYQRVTGVITKYVLTKGADEVYEKIKPLIGELFKHHFKGGNYLDKITTLLGA